MAAAGVAAAGVAAAGVAAAGVAAAGVAAAGVVQAQPHARRCASTDHRSIRSRSGCCGGAARPPASCRIKGAGQEHADERPIATVAQVFELAGLVPGRFRALILLGAFTSLRYGELAALRRSSFGPDCDTVKVTAPLVELRTGELVFGPPKSKAGRRTVTVPATIRAEVRTHLDTHVPDDPDALVFTGSRGGALRPGNFHRAARWKEYVADLGLPGFHFHDLRHTGNTLAAGTGASLADLMARMGHGSTRAALIYQHATQQADKAIADALDQQIQNHRDRARNGHGKRDQAS